MISLFLEDPAGRFRAGAGPVPDSPGARLLVASVAAGLLSFGCGPGGGGSPATYEAPRPAHPAMTADVAVKEADSRSGGRGLPAGHPSVAGGSGGAEAAAGGSSAVEFPEGPIELLGLRFDPPEGWVREPPANSLRLAQFRLPAADEAAGEAVVTVTSVRGSVEDNVRRWEGQFVGSPQADVERREVSGIGVTLVSIAQGTFLHKDRPMAPGPSEERPDHALYAAIVDAPGGQLFFKGWGPRPTIERWRPAFDQMVASLRPVE